MLDDQGVSKPQSVWLDVIINPLFASGGEGTEQENCTFIANEKVRSIRSNDIKLICGGRPPLAYLFCGRSSILAPHDERSSVLTNKGTGLDPSHACSRSWGASRA